MKILFSPYTENFEWLEEFFPERSLCSLPITGKPYAEHAADFAAMLGADGLLILDYTPDSAYRKRLERTSSNYPLDISYAASSLSADVLRLKSRNSAFFGTDDVLVVFGAVLPLVKSADDVLKHMEEISAPVPEDFTQDGIYLFKDGRAFRFGGKMLKMDSIRAYFDANFEILENRFCYVPAGYSAQNGVYAGMNVEIKQNAQIDAPVMLGDNICIEHGCTLAGGVIVCDGSLIDAETLLEHSIVMCDTFVGSKMEFKNKIISMGRIIDAIRGVYIDQKDAGISSDMKSRRLDKYVFVEWILMAFFGVAGFVPWLFASLLLRKNRVWQLKLSLDRYPKLWRSLLRGGRMIRRNTADKNYVLCASDGYCMNASPERQNIDDLYYLHHISLRMILRIVAKSIILRGLPNECDR